MVAERLAGMRTDEFQDTILPALRGHLAIHSGELTDLARERGLVVPIGEPAARGVEWTDLLERLAAVEPLPGASPVELLPVVRDLTAIVEGPLAPAPWWRQILGGGQESQASSVRDEARSLLDILNKLADGVALPPELVKPLIGRFNGALTLDETRRLRALLDELGSDGWRRLGEHGINVAAWTTCHAALDAATSAALQRDLGLVYDSGY